MDVNRALQERRSIKYFDPERPIPSADVERLLQGAMLSPTAFNVQHWRIVSIETPELRRHIRAAAWNQPQMTDAAVLLALCMDLKAWARNPARYYPSATPETQARLSDNLKECYATNPQAERDEGMRSSGLLAMSVMLLAQEMGYDSCPMTGFDFDAVRGLLRLPVDYDICMLLAIGHRLQEPRPRDGRLALDEILVKDHF